MTGKISRNWREYAGLAVLWRTRDSLANLNSHEYAIPRASPAYLRQIGTTDTLLSPYLASQNPIFDVFAATLGNLRDAVL